MHLVLCAGHERQLGAAPLHHLKVSTQHVQPRLPSFRLKRADAGALGVGWGDYGDWRDWQGMELRLNIVHSMLHAQRWSWMC